MQNLTSVFHSSEDREKCSLYVTGFICAALEMAGLKDHDVGKYFLDLQDSKRLVSGNPPKDGFKYMSPEDLARLIICDSIEDLIKYTTDNMDDKDKQSIKDENVSIEQLCEKEYKKYISKAEEYVRLIRSL